MRENFTISVSNGYNYGYLWKILIALVISIVIVYPIMGIGSIQSVVCIIILYLIIYVIMSSITNENLSNDLPSTLYPSLPHTGLDGISLNNYVAGMDVNKYI